MAVAHPFLLATCASAAAVVFFFFPAQVFIVDIYWLPLCALHSHNTKTTTWLDPRLAKKAKPPEKCEDGGMCVDLATQAYSQFH